jgi:hypothetical protein
MPLALVSGSKEAEAHLIKQLLYSFLVSSHSGWHNNLGVLFKLTGTRSRKPGPGHLGGAKSGCWGPRPGPSWLASCIRDRRGFLNNAWPSSPGNGPGSA